MKQKKANSIVTFIAFITIFFALCAFSIDFSLMLITRNNLQNATDNALLSTISNQKIFSNVFEEISITQEQYNNLKLSIRNELKLYKIGSLKNLDDIEFELNIKINPFKVKLKTKTTIPTVFLNILGVGALNLNANSYVGVENIWLNDKMPKLIGASGSLIQQGSIMGRSNSDIAKQYDTVINQSSNNSTLIIRNLSRQNNGNEEGLPFSDFAYKNNPLDIKNYDKPISLGHNGFMTIILPKAIKKKNNSPEFFIKESGNREGYYVLAGIDKYSPLMPNNFRMFPLESTLYTNYAGYTGQTEYSENISWVNISCTAYCANLPNYSLSEDNSCAYKPEDATYTKVFGSAYFNLNNIGSCNAEYGTNLSQMNYVKYLRIIDDGIEDYLPDGQTEPAFAYGESASISPGADINGVAVINHAKIISGNDYNTGGTEISFGQTGH